VAKTGREESRPVFVSYPLVGTFRSRLLAVLDAIERIA
jgi:hypothetical protein